MTEETEECKMCDAEIKKGRVLCSACAESEYEAVEEAILRDQRRTYDERP